MRLLPLLLVAIPFFACAPAAAPCPATPAAALVSAAPAASAGAPAKQFPVAIRLRPDPDKNRVHVDVTARAASEIWSRAEAAAPIEALSAEDESGPLPASAASDKQWSLARPPKGAVTLHYDVVGQPKVRRDVHDVVVSWDIFLAPAESLFVLPAQAPAGEVLVELDTKTFYASAGSTLGMGPRFEGRLTPAQLQHTTWIAGNLGTGVLQNFIERDLGLWTPNATFDARMLLAETAELRSAMGQFFSLPDSAPMSYVLVTYRRGGGSAAAQRRTGGLVVWMDVGQLWNGRLRMSLAQQLAYHWIGDTLWIGPNDPQHEAESYWFVEGFVRYYARELLLRFGALQPSEYLDELLTLGAEQATNPHRKLSNAELALLVRSDPRALAMLRARGSLYATRLDAQLRKASKGKTRLDQLIVALIKEVRDSHKPLPASAFVERIRAELGQDAAMEFDSLIVRGDPGEVPADALGPCFISTPTRYPVEVLGFDPDVTLASADRKVAGLMLGGPAAKAGLLASDTVTEIRTLKDKLEVVIARENKTISFPRYAGFVQGQGWKRDPKVKDEACAGK